MASVSFRDVRKSYTPELQVIHGVSMEIKDGEFIVILGPSGCGKSTLLRMVAGLETITGGEIAIGSRVVNELEPKDRDIAMVFQNYALYPHMSVYQNMSYGLRIKGFSRQEIETRVQMRAELQGLHRRLGTTSLYVTHDQVEAMTLAHRMIVMNAGRAEQIGAPLEVYARPATTFVASFIGSPPMNLIPQERDGRKVLFGIRPEHLEPSAEAGAHLVAEIDLIEPLGADTLVYGHLAGGTRIAARLHSSVDARTGKLPLRYRPEHVHYFDAQTGVRI